MKKILLFTSLVLWLWIAEVSVHGQTLQGEWITGSGGDYTVFAPIVQVDNAGNIYQAGRYSGATMNLGSLSLTGGTRGNVYIASFGSDGQANWVQQFTTNNYIYLLNFHVDQDGTSRVIGSFNGDTVAIAGDTLFKPSGLYDANYYLILDKDGNVLNFSFLAEPLPATDFNIEYGTWDDQGNLAITGINFWDGDTLAFGNIGLAVEKGWSSLFLAYFDPSGTPVWATSSHNSGIGEFIDFMQPIVTIDNNGNITLAATYDGLGIYPVFGTDTLKTLQSANVFLTHFDNTGNFSWATFSEGQSYPILAHLITDSQDNVILSGTFMTDTLRFGAMEFTDTSGADNNFVVKFGTDGTPLWAHMVATENYGLGKKGKSKAQAPTEQPNLILLDSQDNIYLTTWFSNDTLIFPGDTLLNTQGSDNLVVKYLSNGDYDWAKGIPNWDGQPPAATIDENDKLYIFTNLNVTFQIDSVSFTNNGLSTPALILGFTNNGTAFYGNTLEVLDYGYVGPYTIDYDGHAHLILSGNFTADMQINNVSLIPNYSDNLFLARLAYLTRMNGIVSDASMSPVDSGYVYLYKLERSGQAPVEDSVMIRQDGSYEFRDFTYDDYLIYAFADTNNYPDAIGTYYGDEISWELADTVHALQDTLSALDIQLTELTVPLDGNGTIEGLIEYAGTTVKSTASITGEPVKKVKVILIGTEKSTQNVIAWVYTDDQGKYVFQNVPDGNYSIIVDIPGLPMDSTYTVSVTGNVISGLDFLVSETEVLVNTASRVDIPKSDIAALKVWPNPTAGLLELTFTKGDIESVTVFNNQGKVVRRISVKNGLQQLRIDLSEQPAGMYYLRVTGTEITGVTSVIIQH
ncbi:MAG: T9SS type A sorting domain-containing protein [Chlorobi bacterium]|nr:T9SS type A sorting domain-containing protein [Chlorobiota bacterium]